MSSLDKLRQVAEQATPGPWERGDVWLWAGVVNADGTCYFCARHGTPVWTGTSDINGEPMLAHKHRAKDPWKTEHLISSPNGLVTGNYDYEEGGIIAAVDTEFIATFDPPTVLALLDVAEAAEALTSGAVMGAVHLRAGRDANYCDSCLRSWPCEGATLSAALERLADHQETDR